MMWPPTFVREMIEKDQKDVLLTMLTNFENKLHELNGKGMSGKVYTFTLRFILEVKHALNQLKPGQSVDEIATLKVWSSTGYLGIDPFEIDNFINGKSAILDDEDWVID